MKTTRKYYTTEYKKKIVGEFEAGALSAEQIAERERIDRAQIYKWKTQLEAKARGERIEALESAGHNPDDIRRILELEDELAAAKEKIAELAMANDFLKKIHPSFQSERKSSAYAELKQRAGAVRSKKGAR